MACGQELVAAERAVACPVFRHVFGTALHSSAHVLAGHLILCKLFNLPKPSENLLICRFSYIN